MGGPDGTSQGRKRHIVRSGGTNGVEILRVYGPDSSSRKRKSAGAPAQEHALALQCVTNLRGSCKDAIQGFEEACKRKHHGTKEGGPSNEQSVARKERRYRSDELMMDTVAQACFKFLVDKAALDTARKAAEAANGGSLQARLSNLSPSLSTSVCSPRWSPTGQPSSILPEVLHWACRPRPEVPTNPGISLRSSGSGESVTLLGYPMPSGDPASLRLLERPTTSHARGSNTLEGFLDPDLFAGIDGLAEDDGLINFPNQLPWQDQLHMQMPPQAPAFQFPMHQHLPEQQPCYEMRAPGYGHPGNGLQF